MTPAKKQATKKQPAKKQPAERRASESEPSKLAAYRAKRDFGQTPEPGGGPEAQALGPIAFLAAFVLVLSQTLIDGIPSTEALTRLVLWLWVVVMFPATLTALPSVAR